MGVLGILSKILKAVGLPYGLFRMLTSIGLSKILIVH